MQRKTIINILKYVLGIGFLVAVLAWFDIFNSLYLLSDIQIEFFVIACLIVVCVHLLKTLRFYALAQELDVPNTFWQMILAHMIAPIVGRVTPGKLGELSKVALLKGDKKILSFVFILEKLADMITLCIVAVFGIYAFGNYMQAWLGMVVIIIAALIVLWKFEKFLNFFFGKNLLADQWFKENLMKVGYMQWLLYLAYSTLIRFLILSVPWIVAKALGIGVPMWLMFMIFAVSSLIGNLSGLPGGIGTREASFGFLLITYAFIAKEPAGIIVLLSLLADVLVEGILAASGWTINLIRDA